MSDGFIWAAYLVSYGLIAGYAVTVWNRIRNQRSRSPEPRS